MAKTITQLDDAGALQNNNFFEVIQGGLSKKTTFQNLVESIPVASDTQNGLMSAAVFNQLSRILITRGNGSGAIIARLIGINYIYAYQVSNPNNFVFYTVNRTENTTNIANIASNVLNTGAYNLIGTVVITGAEANDIKQISLGVSL